MLYIYLICFYIIICTPRIASWCPSPSSAPPQGKGQQMPTIPVIFFFKFLSNDNDIKYDANYYIKYINIYKLMK